MAKTTIPYVSMSFSPWIGCVEKDETCAHCFAKAIDKRFYGGGHWGKDAERRWQSDNYWDQPLAWNRAAERAGRTDGVLCGTMCDILEPRASLHHWRHKLAQLIHRTPSLEWFLLSKEPHRQHLLASTLKTAPNVLLGATVGTQAAADERIPALCEWPGRRWLSLEPLIEPVSIERWATLIAFAVVGCESGPGRRPMELDWVRALRDECLAHDVAFFYKQGPAADRRTVAHCPALDGRQWLETP